MDRRLMSDPLEKRSLTIAGHRSSLALEPDFWDALRAMAKSRGLTVSAMVVEIDRQRGPENLASAVRVAVLAHYRGSEPVV